MSSQDAITIKKMSSGNFGGLPESGAYDFCDN